MKIQAVMVLTAVLILTTLVAESECISPGEKETSLPREGVEAFACQINARLLSSKSKLS